MMGMVSPMDTAIAQESESNPDGDKEYKEGEHKGKSCPFKDKKTATTNTGSNI